MLVEQAESAKAIRYELKRRNLTRCYSRYLSTFGKCGKSLMTCQLLCRHILSILRISYNVVHVLYQYVNMYTLALAESPFGKARYSSIREKDYSRNAVAYQGAPRAG
jgi:hypothetical protein